MKDEEQFVSTCGHVLFEGEWIPADWVEFIDIGEDIQGRDVMTFKHKGKVCKSYITERPR